MSRLTTLLSFKKYKSKVILKQLEIINIFITLINHIYLTI